MTGRERDKKKKEREALDDRDALAKLRGLHRRPLAAGSRPDDNDVIFQIAHAGSIPRGPCLALFLAFPAEGS